MALTTEQLLLLNNLMYTHESNFPNGLKLSDNHSDVTTVSDYITLIEGKISNMDSSRDCGAYMTAEDYGKIINAIKNDRELMDMKIATTHIDNGSDGGGGFSAVFINEETGDAVVTFKGTEPDEWPDNFKGATYTGENGEVATPHQENALEWYREVYDELGLDQYEVTVTGHSKGGNKAKFITVLDDSVDHCVSFDGQGFSDEFLDKYRDEIAINQGKIENHNADNDYVNMLLNDIGEKHFYKSNNIGSGDGGLLEFHCPNSFMTIGKDGTVTMDETSQGPVIKMIDAYLTGMLRTMPEELRGDAAEMIGTIVTGCMNNKGIEFVIGQLLDSNNSDSVAHIIAYTLDYLEALPLVAADQLTSIPGISVLFDVVNKISSLDDSILLKILEGADFLNDKLIAAIEKIFNVDINNGNLDALMDMLKKISEKRGKINIGDNSDRVISSGGSRNADFYVKTDVLRMSAEKLRSIAASLARLSDEIEGCKMSYTMGVLFNSRIRSHAAKTQKQSDIFSNIAKILDSSAKMYNETENKIMNT